MRFVRLPDGNTRGSRMRYRAQRPDAKASFLSLEDETGISNVIVRHLYERYALVINRESSSRDGILQNQDHTISIKASRVLPISITSAETQSHDSLVQAGLYSKSAG